MSTRPTNQPPPPAPGTDDLELTGTKATTGQMVLGGAFLIVCIVVCGGFFGWFGGDRSPRGIGVSRDAVERPLGEVGFGFRPSADHRGFPCEEATSADGICHVRLVGPRDQLVYASIAVDLNKAKTDEHHKVFGLLVIALLHHAVPDWTPQESLAWLNECMDAAPKGKRQSEKNTEHARVRFVVTPNPVTMTVSVESKDW